LVKGGPLPAAASAAAGVLARAGSAVNERRANLLTALDLRLWGWSRPLAALGAC
jgi:hypothetical protein